MTPPLATNDRTLRRFQVIMGDKRTTATPAAQTRPADEQNMVQYGWRTGKDGGLEYLVQMTPERLETLAKGVPLICEVDPQVPEISCIYVYAGVGQVPRSEIPSSQFGAPVTPPLLTGGETTGPATPPLPRPRIEAPRTDQSPIYDPRSHATPGYGLPYDDRSGNWRNDAPANNSPAAPRTNDPPAWDTRANDWRNSQTSGTDERSIPGWSVPQDRVSPVGYDTRTAQRTEVAAPPANYPQRGAASEPARTEAAPPAPAAPASPVWQTPAAQQPPSNVWNQGSSTLSRSAVSDVRPWTPLILTTLGLFASLGANAYLGWLAWSFFWRYRDAATDLGRSRSSAGGSRQAA